MSNQDQIDYWNGETGDKWVTHADALDRMLAPFAEAVIKASGLGPSDRVVDIGCGSGALSRMAYAEGGRVSGVDVSEPMLGLARDRAAAQNMDIAYELADASSFQSDQKFQHVISRFGVMFFNDPGAAFANIHAQTAQGGTLTFACWQNPMANGWAMTPLQIAMPFLKEPPTPPEPRAPGPFAFAEADYVTDILKSSGWKSIEINALTPSMILPGDNPQESATFMLRMGPMGRILKEQEIDLTPIAKALTEHFDGLKNDQGQVVMESAAWLVRAEA